VDVRLKPEDRRPEGPWRLAGRAPRLNVMMVASEVAPWAKTGGLADVAAALPEALDQLGHRTVVVMPRYRGIVLPAVRTTARRVRLGPITHEVALHVATLSARRRVVFVDAPAFFDRDGYYGVGGQDFGDNAQRFALLSAAALEFAEYDDPDERVDIIHAHDWQAGLVPVWLRALPARWPRLAGAGRVFTIHNLAYQGVFPREVVPAIGLPWDVFRVDGGEFWGRFSFLKAGITFSDYVTTVSPTYARETQRPEFGFGMEGVLASRRDRYIGILNGIDTRLWNPAVDASLPVRYDVDSPAGKRACKRALLARFGLAQGDDALDRPVVAMVSRLIEQKGLGLVTDAREALVSLDVTWIFVGTGEARYELALRELAARHPTRVGVFIGFDEALAHLVEAGADMFLMPSLFEPCGLSQLYSLRYGTVPIVRAVGGLDDTVQPYTARARRANGFKFHGATPDAMTRTIRQAVRLYHDPDAWRRLMRQGMIEDHSWETSAREYVRVYRRTRHDAAIRGAADAPGRRRE
jgi:starch synthase